MKTKRKLIAIAISSSILTALYFLISINYTKIDYVHLLVSLIILLFAMFIVPVFIDKDTRRFAIKITISIGIIIGFFGLFWIVFLWSFHTIEQNNIVQIKGTELTYEVDSLIKSKSISRPEDYYIGVQDADNDLIWSDINTFKLYFITAYYLFIFFGSIALFTSFEYLFYLNEYKIISENNVTHHQPLQPH